MRLLQRRNAIQRFAAARTLPIVQQFWLVERRPFKDETKRGWRETSTNRARVDVHGDLVFSMNGMKVRRTMFVEEHADDDAEEARELRHVPFERDDDDAIVVVGKSMTMRRAAAVARPSITQW